MGHYYSETVSEKELKEEKEYEENYRKEQAAAIKDLAKLFQAILIGAPKEDKEIIETFNKTMGTMGYSKRH